MRQKGASLDFLNTAFNIVVVAVINSILLEACANNAKVMGSSFKHR